MTATQERRRTAGDVVLGFLLLLAGLYLLGNAVFATAISVLVLGWSALISGTVLVVRTILGIRSGWSWPMALGGVVLAVLGLFILRNPVVGAVTLTLLAGSLLLTTGLARMFGAVAVPEARGVLLVSGLVSAGLGVFVLLNLATASLTLLGVLLGVQTLIEGATLIAIGRLRPAAPRPVATPTG